jgi:serine/threonine protein kinase
VPKSGPKSLVDLFSEYQDFPPLLNERFELARKLASALSLMHASRWLHKGFRSDNIVFFHDKSSISGIDITNPYVCGFEYSRPDTQKSFGDLPTGNPAIDLCYHPDVPLQGFNRVRDTYSLAVVLIEIAIWGCIADKIAEVGHQLSKMTMSDYRAFFLDSMPIIGSQMGPSYRDAVRVCLTGDFGVAADDDGSGLARAFFTKVLQKLSYCRARLQRDSRDVPFAGKLFQIYLLPESILPLLSLLFSVVPAG